MPVAQRLLWLSMRDMSNLSSASRYTKDGGITVCMDARPPPLDDAALPLPRLWPPPLNDAADRRFFFAGCLPGGLTMRMPPFLPMRLPFGGSMATIGAQNAAFLLAGPALRPRSRGGPGEVELLVPYSR